MLEHPWICSLGNSRHLRSSQPVSWQCDQLFLYRHSTQIRWWCACCTCPTVCLSFRPSYQILTPYRFVFFLSGLAHVTIPNVTTPESSAWIYGGKTGLVLALDTHDVSRYGHITTYPSASDTVAIQIPLSVQGYHGLLKRRKVLYEGGCKESEYVGI